MNLQAVNIVGFRESKMRCTAKPRAQHQRCQKILRFYGYRFTIFTFQLLRRGGVNRLQHAGFDAFVNGPDGYGLMSLALPAATLYRFSVIVPASAAGTLHSGRFNSHHAQIPDGCATDHAMTERNTTIFFHRRRRTLCFMRM